jgi:hypothetical protein
VQLRVDQDDTFAEGIEEAIRLEDMTDAVPEDGIVAVDVEAIEVLRPEHGLGGRDTLDVNEVAVGHRSLVFVACGFGRTR